MSKSKIGQQLWNAYKNAVAKGATSVPKVLAKANPMLGWTAGLSGAFDTTRAAYNAGRQAFEEELKANPEATFGDLARESSLAALSKAAGIQPKMFAQHYGPAIGAAQGARLGATAGSRLGPWGAVGGGLIGGGLGYLGTDYLADRLYKGATGVELDDAIRREVVGQQARELAAQARPVTPPVQVQKEIPKNVEQIAQQVTQAVQNTPAATTTPAQMARPILRGPANITQQPTEEIMDNEKQTVLQGQVIKNQPQVTTPAATPGRVDAATLADLMDQYQRIQQEATAAQLAANPYYQGPVVQPQGYNYSKGRHNVLSVLDGLLAGANVMSGGSGQNASDYVGAYQQNMDQQYRNRVANQAGVPYEDYMRGIQAQQVAKADEARNMAQMLSSVMTQMQEGDREIALQRLKNSGALDAATLDYMGGLQRQSLANQGTANVANINAGASLGKQSMANASAADIARMNNATKAQVEAAKLADPANRFNKVAGPLSDLAFGNPAAFNQLMKAYGADFYNKALTGGMSDADLMNMNNPYYQKLKMDAQTGDPAAQGRLYQMMMRGMKANEQ